MARPQLYVIDGRGPGKWTTTDRTRSAAIAAVSAGWTEPAIASATNLVWISATYVTYDGKPAGPMAALGDEARAKGYDLLPCLNVAGQVRPTRVCLWRETTTEANGSKHLQEQWALNMAQMDIAEWFARQVASRWPWAAGFHIDWWTPVQSVFEGSPQQAPGIVGVNRPEEYWPQYMNGLSRMVHRIKAVRGPGTIVVGQQWHTQGESIDKNLTGLFIEQSPERWPLYGQTYEVCYNKVFGQLLSWQGDGVDPVNVMELRYPSLYSSVYINRLLKYCLENGLYLAYGRDQTCGVGVPQYDPR